MATLLSRDECIAAVERVASGTYEGSEATAWIGLVETSLGIATGALAALVFYPDESGVSEDATGEELIARALVES